jgi:hypothetical protein
MKAMSTAYSLGCIIGYYGEAALLATACSFVAGAVSFRLLRGRRGLWFGVLAACWLVCFAVVKV